MRFDNHTLKDILNECLPYVDYPPLKKRMKKMLDDLPIEQDADIIMEKE